jgi:hypothetical protein
MADNRIQFTFEINDKGKVKVDGLTKSFVSLDNAVNKVSVDLKRQQAELGKSNTGLNNTISNAGLAGATLTELGRTISDSNYGIRGMANNLSQLSTLFITFVGKQNKGGLAGVISAFKGLGAQLMGPLGVILAFQTLLAVFEGMAIKSEEVARNTKKIEKAFSSARKIAMAFSKEIQRIASTDKLVGRGGERKQGTLDAMNAVLEQLIETAPKFAAAFERLDDKSLQPQGGAFRLVLDYQRLLETQDELSDALAKEKVDYQEIYEIQSRLLPLQKQFNVEKKKAAKVDIETVKPEDPLTFGEVFGLDFGPSRQEVQDALDSFIEDAEDVINTQVANEQMPNLLKVLLGLDPNSREKELQVLRDTFDEILHETKEFKLAEAAINEKYDVIERQEKFDHYSYMIGGLADFLDKAAQLNEQNKGLAKLSIIASAAAASIGIWESWFVKDKSLTPAPARLVGAIATQGALVASTVAALRSLNSGTAPGQDAGGAGAGSSQAPVFNVVGQSNVDQLGRAISEARSEPLKAYVVGSEVSNQQDLDNKIIQSATLGT